VVKLRLLLVYWWCENHCRSGASGYLYFSSGKDLVIPETGESDALYDHRKEHQWCHLDLFNRKCFIHYRNPRVQTPKGPKTISIPWADPSSRFTYAFECFVILSWKQLRTRLKQRKFFGADWTNSIALCTAELSAESHAGLWQTFFTSVLTNRPLSEAIPTQRL